MRDQVSIIIPTYNRQETLKEVLPSYLSQTGVDEIIIVDDGSVPPVSLCLEQRLLAESRLQVVRHRRSLGSSIARNTGVSAASAEYVFFGEDDLVLPADHVATLVRERERLNADLVCGRLLQQVASETIEQAERRAVREQRLIFDHHHISVRTEHLERSAELPFAHAIFLASRELLSDYRFSGHLGGPSFLREDGELQLRLRRDGYRLFATPSTYSFHMARHKTSGAGTRSAQAAWIQIASATVNSWQVIDEYHAEISPFFGKMDKAIMLRRIIASSLVIGLKRHARAKSSSFNWLVEQLRQVGR